VASPQSGEQPAAFTPPTQVNNWFLPREQTANDITRFG
jgi:hypothetical protein